MSKLLDLISKFGQQAAQPIGFEALAGRTVASPSMALIGIASASTCDRDLDAIGRELVDAVVFDPDEARLALEAGQFDDLIWGIVYRSMEEEVLESLVSAGCDFIFFETYNAPATIISQPEVALIACLEAPVSRKTSAALRSLGVDGSWNLSGEVRLGGLEFEDLIGLNKIAASTGGVTLVNDEGGSSLATLTALRNAGVDGLVTSLSNHERVIELAQAVRQLPPRNPHRSKGFQALSPESSR